jgi:hypothetical protein
VLSEATVREMLRPQVERVGEIALGNKQHVDRMGLGFFLGDAAHPDLFGHIGDDEGFQAMLMMYGDSGKGVAILANSEHGIRLGDYLIQNLAREYGWDYAPTDRHRIASLLDRRIQARRPPGVFCPALRMRLFAARCFPQSLALDSRRHSNQLSSGGSGVAIGPSGPLTAFEYWNSTGTVPDPLVVGFVRSSHAAICLWSKILVRFRLIPEGDWGINCWEAVEALRGCISTSE